MIPTPSCVGLMLCEKYVVEEHSRNLTLVNCFQRLAVAELPWTPAPFFVYFCLTDGMGNGKLELEIADSESLGIVHEAETTVQFDDPTKRKRFVFKISGCTFRVSGRHQITISADKELVALAAFDLEVVED